MGDLGQGCSIASSLSPQQRQQSTQDARKGGVDNVLLTQAIHRS
jgi:hypothetical protein